MLRFPKSEIQILFEFKSDFFKSKIQKNFEKMSKSQKIVIFRFLYFSLNQKQPYEKLRF